ncbi:MAG TPA: efflux RND transporter periplasmic adaptor subunit [Nitrospinota bacterium]|nr:efflux RND transporter periplasmic adaptor subunit [Nitrospinota bacterium]
MKNRKNLIIATSIIILLIGVFLGLRFTKESKGKDKDFKLEKVVLRTVNHTILATGTVKPVIGAEVKVGSRISGLVERLMVKIGDKVKKGDLIATIEHNDLLAKVEGAKANLLAEEAKETAIREQTPKEIEKARAEIDEKVAELNLAEINYKRQQSLVSKGVSPQEKLDQAKKELDVLKAGHRALKQNLIYLQTKYLQDLALAKARVKQAKASLMELETELSYARIRAPIAGSIASISTQEGETVAAGFNAPTFVNIIDLSQLQVNAFVDETDIGKIQMRQQATFTVDSFPKRPFRGGVVAIYPKAIIQENVVNYEVIITIKDDFIDLLRPEMTANVNIIIGTKENALAIPTEAIKNIKGRKIVYVFNRGKLIERTIKTGWRERGFVEIIDGLKKGEEVAVFYPLSEAEKNLRRIKR